jgi:HD-GYP domain-containing protein (c-di-GMP phosphodiesterase class II)
VTQNDRIFLRTHVQSWLDRGELMARGSSTLFKMNSRTKWYLFWTSIGATLCSLVLYWQQPEIPVGSVGAVLLLSALALVAEALTLLMPNSVSGSIAFIPYLAAALVVPHWTALVGAVVVRALAEITTRRAAPAAIFNTAQHAITFSCAVLVFLLLGGESMAFLKGQPLVAVTVRNGLASLAAFVISFGVNSTLVLGFVAGKSNRSFVELWRGTYLSTIGLDILASPLIFLFAWVYVNWGAFAAAALWIPILGLRQLQKNNLDLERTNNELLELMVKSMEARDPYTSGHSRRVQQYSLAIARGMSLPPGEAEQIGRASLLHDVGKIHDKYAPILRKPGKLSADEWQTMQQHPVDGAELISTMSKLQDIVPSIRHHHERWDGTGYPDGLAGETIPRVSRIIAFADTIDAMVSERPYRRTLTEQEVRTELVRCRGSQFDPEITDKVLSAPVWRLLFPPETAEGIAKTPLSLFGSTKPSVAREA